MHHTVSTCQLPITISLSFESNSTITFSIISLSHEGLDLYAPVSNPDPTRPLHGVNQWPSQTEVPNFQSTYERWVDRMKELGLIVMEA